MTDGDLAYLYAGTDEGAVLQVELTTGAVTGLWPVHDNRPIESLAWFQSTASLRSEDAEHLALVTIDSRSKARHLD